MRFLAKSTNCRICPSPCPHSIFWRSRKSPEKVRRFKRGVDTPSLQRGKVRLLARVKVQRRHDHGSTLGFSEWFWFIL